MHPAVGVRKSLRGAKPLCRAWQEQQNPVNVRTAFVAREQRKVKAYTLDRLVFMESKVARSRIPRFYKMSIDERVRAVHERGVLTDNDFESLVSGDATLALTAADKMIENVIGVLGLPIGLGLNFLINSKEYVVPLVVEEPSIVAALSAAAKMARTGGGFTTTSTDPILIGQIQVIEVPDITRGKAAIIERKQEILDLANSFPSAHGRPWRRRRRSSKS